MLQSFLMGVLSLRANSGPPPPPPPNLDSLSTGLYAACSLYRLLTAYTGHAIQVRRDSDNSIANIDFNTNGTLDTATLAAFVGSASAYVQTIYDQSGNGNDFYQPTAGLQPRIVNAGTYDNVVYFDGTDDVMQSVNNNNSPAAVSLYMRGTLRSSGVRQLVMISDSAGNGGSDAAHGEVLWDYEPTFHGMRNAILSNVGVNVVVNEATSAALSANTNTIVSDFSQSTNTDRVPYYVNGTLMGNSISTAGTVPTTVVLTPLKWQLGYGPIGGTNYGAQLSMVSLVMYEVGHNATDVAAVAGIVDHYH